MAKRAIYEVYAKVVDANGNYNTLSGYPKAFDSRNYDNNADRALLRAQAEYHETLGAMYKREDRIIQTAMLLTANGYMIQTESIGTFPDEPDGGGE